MPNGLGPETGAGCTILLSVGRVLLLIGMILSNADISMGDDFVAGLFHDWPNVVPALCVVPQETLVAELTAPGNIVDPVPTPAAGRCPDVFRRVEERSRTDGFVDTDMLGDAADEAICN